MIALSLRVLACLGGVALLLCVMLVWAALAVHRDGDE